MVFEPRQVSHEYHSCSRLGVGQSLPTLSGYNARPRSRMQVMLRQLWVGCAFALYGIALHRSEEHTSELQSRENLVCRLLLEKKKDGTAPTRGREHHS